MLGAGTEGWVCVFLLFVVFLLWVFPQGNPLELLIFLLLLERLRLLVELLTEEVFFKEDFTLGAGAAWEGFTLVEVLLSTEAPLPLFKGSSGILIRTGATPSSSSEGSAQACPLKHKHIKQAIIKVKLRNLLCIANDRAKLSHFGVHSFLHIVEQNTPRFHRQGTLFLFLVRLACQHQTNTLAIGKVRHVIYRTGASV